jgi:hypothetical protein
MTGHDEQAAIFERARWYAGQHPELDLLFAVPNGAKLPFTGKGKHRWSPEAQRLKKEGLRRGVPDMCLPVARLGYHGLFIELKYGDNKPSCDQAEYLDRLTEQGYLAVVCWGSNEAWNIICEYLGISSEI